METSPAAQDEAASVGIIEMLIRVATLAVLVLLCVQIARPFLEAVLWGVIIAVAAYPTHQALVARLHGRRRMAAALVTLALLAAFLVPSIFLTESLVTGTQWLAGGLSAGSLKVPPPPAEVQSLPLVGARLDSLWRLASQNLQAAIEAEQATVKEVARWVLGIVTSTGKALLQFLVATIISGVVLARADDGAWTARAVARRLAGARGPEFAVLGGQVVRSVARGIIGVAIIQSLLAGAGMLVAGVPAAGFLTLVCLVLCVVQLGPGIVLIPVAVYLFSSASTGTAVAFLVWSLLVLPVDNVLKPMLLGRGVRVPMVVMFIGAIGGFLRSGIIGLFLGAVVFALGYELFRAWIADEPSAGEGAAAA